MNENNIDIIYTALKYAGNYVDENKLSQGIYSTQKPCLYDENDTLDELIKRVEDYYGRFMKDSPVDIYISNLKKCTLVKVKITLVNEESMPIKNLNAAIDLHNEFYGTQIEKAKS